MNKIPEGINQQHILAAIRDFDAGLPHSFGESTGYDVLYEHRRYPPKALVGLAAGKILGTPLGPKDFKAGLRSKCFRVLTTNGFTIITKAETSPFPDDVEEDEVHIEGAVQKVAVNRYERNPEARQKCIKHYGASCQVCDFDFERVYGPIGEGFIHVHHMVPLSEVGAQYIVDPINDLRPVCPNCHAMLHKRKPPYTVQELRQIVNRSG